MTRTILIYGATGCTGKLVAMHRAARLRRTAACSADSFAARPMCLPASRALACRSLIIDSSDAETAPSIVRSI
jgi:short subunit dehydrogenase-like uncharacterized protein